RRTGDLMALATHDVELVEYFFAHTVAPAFVAILVPAVVVAGVSSGGPPVAPALVPVPGGGGPQPLLMGQRRGRPGPGSARGRGRARRLRGRFGAGTGRDRRLPAGGGARVAARCALRSPHPVAPALLPRIDAAAQPARGLHRARRPRRRGGRRGFGGTG